MPFGVWSPTCICVTLITVRRSGARTGVVGIGSDLNSLSNLSSRACSRRMSSRGSWLPSMGIVRSHPVTSNGCGWSVGRGSRGSRFTGIPRSDVTIRPAGRSMKMLRWTLRPLFLIFSRLLLPLFYSLVKPLPFHSLVISPFHVRLPFRPLAKPLLLVKPPFHSLVQPLLFVPERNALHTKRMPLWGYQAPQLELHKGPL